MSLVSNQKLTLILLYNKIVREDKNPLRIITIFSSQHQQVRKIVQKYWHMLFQKLYYSHLEGPPQLETALYKANIEGNQVGPLQIQRYLGFVSGGMENRL